MTINLLRHRLTIRRMADKQASAGEIAIPDTDWEKGISLSVHKEAKTFYVVSPPDIKDRDKFLIRLRTTFPNIEFIPIDPVDPVDIDKQAMRQLAAELPADKITESDVFLGIAAGTYKGSIASLGLIARGVSPAIGFASFLFQLGNTMLTLTGRPIFNRIVLSNWHNPQKKVSAPIAYIRNMSMDGVAMAFAGLMVPAAAGALSLTSARGFLEFMALVIGNQYLNSCFLTVQQKQEESKKLTKVGARWGLFYKMLATQPAVLAKLFHLGSANAVKAAFPGLLFKGSLGTIIPAIPAFIIILDLWTVLIAVTYLAMIAWAYFFHESMNRIGAASQAQLDKILERKVVSRTLGALGKREESGNTWPIDAEARKNVAISVATHLEEHREKSASGIILATTVTPPPGSDRGSG